jgi:hypothetical protein
MTKNELLVIVQKSAGSFQAKLELSQKYEKWRLTTALQERRCEIFLQRFGTTSQAKLSLAQKSYSGVVAATSF